MTRAVLLALAAGVLAAETSAADWVRAGLNTNAPAWGARGRLQFAIYPGGFSGGNGGPRGLIRLGYPVLTNGPPDSGRVSHPEPGVEQLEVIIHVERFDNGQTFVFGITARTPEELGFKPGA